MVHLYFHHVDCVPSFLHRFGWSLLLPHEYATPIFFFLRTKELIHQIIFTVIFFVLGIAQFVGSNADLVTRIGGYCPFNQPFQNFTPNPTTDLPLLRIHPLTVGLVTAFMSHVYSSLLELS